MNKIIVSLLLIGLHACTAVGLEQKSEPVADCIKERHYMISESIQKSRAYTLAILDQVPDSIYSFRPVPEVMSFSQHFRHNAIFTCNQLAGRLDRLSPYKEYRPKVDMDKEETNVEINRMYDFMEEVLNSLSEEDLEKEIEFGDEMIPAWRLFGIVENHIIHHRGACIVYMRMNGIVPKGYFGW